LTGNYCTSSQRGRKRKLANSLLAIRHAFPGPTETVSSSKKTHGFIQDDFWLAAFENGQVADIETMKTSKEEREWLHWLPVHLQRIKFKMAAVVYKTLHG